jgi:hypothetical protein
VRAVKGVAALAVLAAALATPIALSKHDPPGLALAPHAAPAAPAAPARRGLATDQVNVSRAPSAQAEVAVAVDPTNANLLLGGSGSFERSNRVYSSTDGGATWSSDALPSPRGLCAFGDPAVAIDDTGRQYYAYLVGSCLTISLRRVDVALATRPDAASPWVAHTLTLAGSTSFNDKEAIAVDTSPASAHHGRLYVSWSRLQRATNSFQIVVAHSDDAGATWSPAVPVGAARGSSQTFSSLAVGADGTLDVAWLTLDRHVQMARSVDGGEHFAQRTFVALAANLPAGTCRIGGMRVPAQPSRCISSAPQVTADRVRGRVYVTWGAAGRTGTEENVYVSSYDAATLAPLVTGRQVNPPDVVVGDQFLPASAVDESTGRLWACWYDTTGDRTRRRTRYSCASSADDGATWSPPQQAAAVFSNETVRRATTFEYGDYAGLAVAAGVAHPMWTDTRELAVNAEEIYTTALQLPQ